MSEIQKDHSEIKDKLHICTEIMENLSNQKCRFSHWLFSQNIQITDWIGEYTYIWDRAQAANGNVNKYNYTTQSNYPDVESDCDIDSILLFLISCDFDYLLSLYSMSQMNLDIDFMDYIYEMYDDDIENSDCNIKAKTIFESLIGG